MPNELLDHVRDELIPMLRPPSHVVDDMRAGGGALVILRAGDLRVQITRDRGEMRADFGSMATPHVSFDEQVVGEHLGLGRGTGFGAPDLTQSMRAIASFLK